MVAGALRRQRRPAVQDRVRAALLRGQSGRRGGGRRQRRVLRSLALALPRVRGEIDYLKRIVEDFLSFAREEKLSRAQLSAKELLESARELIQADADAKQVALSLSADVATLEGDQSLLVAALVNLVKNAVQA